MPTCHMHTQHVNVYLQVYQHPYTTYQHAIYNCNMLSCMHNMFMGWPTRQLNSNQVALKKTFKLLRSSACLETIVMGGPSDGVLEDEDHYIIRMWTPLLHYGAYHTVPSVPCNMRMK